LASNHPRVQTDTVASAGGDIESIDTRVPPSDLHETDFREALGEKPVALLFASPRLCQTRVCGPVVDIAAQMMDEYGDRMDFNHQEVYVDNEVSKGLRAPLEAFWTADRSVAIHHRRRRAGGRTARGVFRR